MAWELALSSAPQCEQNRSVARTLAPQLKQLSVVAMASQEVVASPLQVSG
jgi:hypothetical protein